MAAYRTGKDAEALAWLRKSRHLPLKNLLEAVVIGYSCERRAITGKRNRGEGLTILGKTPQKLGCKMLGFGGATSIAHDQYFAAAVETLTGFARDALKIRDHRRPTTRQQFG
jgi:hypothetical protein